MILCQKLMTQKKNEPFDPKKVTCTIDDVEVDCETWGDPVLKAEANEIESELDFLSHFDS